MGVKTENQEYGSKCHKQKLIKIQYRPTQEANRIVKALECSLLQQPSAGGRGLCRARTARSRPGAYGGEPRVPL